MERRTFFKVSGGISLVLLVGATALALRRTKLKRPPSDLKFFSTREYSIFSSAAERLIPSQPDSQKISDLDIAFDADQFLSTCRPNTVSDLKRVLALFDNALAGLLIAGTIRPFTQMEPEQQETFLNAWRFHRLSVFRSAYSALKRLVMAIYYGNEKTWAHIGYPGPPVIAEALPDQGVASPEKIADPENPTP